MVQAGAVETHYRRAGTGAAVLLLSARGLDEPQTAELFRALAAGLKVTAPLVPAEQGDTGLRRGTAVSHSAWLRDLMDGLGLECAAIVADGTFAIITLDFASTDPERVDRLVILNRDRPDPLIAGAVREDALQRNGHPLLIVRMSPIAARNGSPPWAADIRAFLAASPAALQVSRSPGRTSPEQGR